jgi:asparagine synthase (glutamine-hydrolysing)
LRSRVGLQLFPEMAGCYYKHFWEGWDRYGLYSKELSRQLQSAAFPFAASPPDGCSADTALSDLAWWDQSSYLPGALLLKTDMTTMAYGLEARAPLLDHLLAAHAAGLPQEDKVSVRETKKILRRIAARWLPDSLVHRPKRGFGLPLRRWLQTDLSPWVRDLLLGSSVTVPRYFSGESVKRMIEEHVSGRKNHTGRLYTLVVFELWHRNHIP